MRPKANIRGGMSIYAIDNALGVPTFKLRLPHGGIKYIIY
jgi:hypothetical protein